MNRRDFVGHLSGWAIVASRAVGLSGLALTLEGCDKLDELQNWASVAVVAFDGVAAAVDAAFTGIATIVDAEWLAVSKGIDIYRHSTEPDATKLDKLIKRLDALAGGLTDALNGLPVGMPAALLAASKAVLALTIVTLKRIRDKLQPAQAARAAIYAAAAGVIPATSTNDYKTRVNQIWTSAGMPALVK